MNGGRYTEPDKPTGRDITDIPGKRHNPYIDSQAKRDNSRSRSPNKYSGLSTKGAEMLTSDMVYSNEAKIRNQIRHYNKEGICGPFIGLDSSGPAPKSPKIPMGSSSYKMHFSPGKKRDVLPKKLQDSMSMISNSTMPLNLRHMSNGDAFNRHNALSSSIDLGRSPGSRVHQAKNMSFERSHDHFRFKKNLTTNADRILSNPGSYNQTPAHDSSKYEEMRKHVENSPTHVRSPMSKPSPKLSSSKTQPDIRGEENVNTHNVHRIEKPFMQEPAGGYNSAHLKRNMGMPAQAQVDSHIGGMLNAQMKNSLTLGQNSSMYKFNDPGYHRVQSYNNYGFDVLTGVRKDSNNRVL